MQLQNTIQQYFHQPSLAGVGLSELEKAVRLHPYSAALHFLLLKKMEQEADPGFEKQFAATALYFPNPWLLRQQLAALDREETAAAAPLTIDERTAPLQMPEEGLAGPDAGYQPAMDEVSEPLVAEDAEAMGETAEMAAPPQLETNVAQELRTDILQRESPIRIPSLKDISPQTEEMPLFEPYHTIDYFASQGIKLSNELPVNDRLGRQMKSFTEWIRVMKKLPHTEIEQQLLDAGLGEKIVAMAEGSVEMKEVLTETMAEVLVKQGKINRAIDLYNKLSLAHPDKSAYFATRIEQLKQR